MAGVSIHGGTEATANPKPGTAGYLKWWPSSSLAQRAIHQQLTEAGILNVDPVTDLLR